MSFTLVFGLYSAFVFMQSKSIVSAIILHFYCNTLGFPQIN